jgi:hypothetical protein
MRTASSQDYTANCVISIVLTLFLFLTSAVGLTVFRAAIVVEQIRQIATQSRAAHMYPSRIKP